MIATTFRSEAFARGTRMLRTALGASIASYLEDPSIVEVMLNPDGRLWIDRLSGGLEDSGRVMAAVDGERIVRLVAHNVGAEVTRVGYLHRIWAVRGVTRLSASDVGTPSQKMDILSASPAIWIWHY